VLKLNHRPQLTVQVQHTAVFDVVRCCHDYTDPSG